MYMTKKQRWYLTLDLSNKNVSSMDGFDIFNGINLKLVLFFSSHKEHNENKKLTKVVNQHV